MEFLNNLVSSKIRHLYNEFLNSPRTECLLNLEREMIEESYGPISVFYKSINAYIDYSLLVWVDSVLEYLSEIRIENNILYQEEDEFILSELNNVIKDEIKVAIIFAHEVSKKHVIYSTGDLAEYKAKELSEKRDSFNKQQILDNVVSVVKDKIAISIGETNLKILKNSPDLVKLYEVNIRQDSKGAEPLCSSVETICRNFHKFCNQLTKRYDNRQTIIVSDEYDVQDLLHSIFKLHFSDVRAEEYTPSYAGGASRIDFLLADEEIAVEVKKTRTALKDKHIGEQLIVDTRRYSVHPKCKRLICFVYDPELLIKNPEGIENDLSKPSNGIDVQVIISPKGN